MQTTTKKEKENMLDTEKLDTIIEKNEQKLQEAIQAGNCQVSAIQHYDVYGKQLLYLKIEKPGIEAVMINIGAKTYAKIAMLETLTK